MQEIEISRWLFSYLQDRTANPANLAAIFCPALVCPQQSSMIIKFFAYSLQFPCQVGIKIDVKYRKDFLLYFTTLETYRVLLFKGELD